MKHLIALYQVKLTKDSPAPPVLHAFKIHGETPYDRKRAFYDGVHAMQEKYHRHEYFEKMMITEDHAADLMVDVFDIDLNGTNDITE